ncbi:MAG: hypothetical protein ACFB12_20880 [Leptolyngbyaceae cyanobacterium]
MLNKPSFQTYYASLDRLVAAELEKERPDYLAQVEFEEYLDHLINRLAWETLEFDEGAMTMEPFIDKRTINDFGRVIDVDQPRVRLRIPVSQHSQRRDFLEFMPSSVRYSVEPDWRFEGSILVMEADANEKAVERALDEVRFWIGGRNNDVKTGNTQLRQRIEPLWRRKREEIERHFGKLKTLTETLKIPLHQSASAPKPLRVQQKPRVSKPALKPGTPEPELDHRSVVEIVDFVETYARQLEVTPTVYSKLKEEELRDLVLSMLNINYPGSSAETFSKKGKTDLYLRSGGGGSLIVECKRWNGPKKYGEALNQLFGYLTWRHGYGVLLTFSTNRDMTACVTATKELIAKHPTVVPDSIRGCSSRFTSRHIHPQDRGKEVEVFHLFVDLSISPRA